MAYNLWNSFDLPINNFVTKTFGIPFTWPINLMIMLRDTEKGELVGTRTRQGKGENSEPTEGRPLNELICELRDVVTIAVQVN